MSVGEKNGLLRILLEVLEEGEWEGDEEEMEIVLCELEEEGERRWKEEKKKGNKGRRRNEWREMGQLAREVEWALEKKKRRGREGKEEEESIVTLCGMQKKFQENEAIIKGESEEIKRKSEENRRQHDQLKRENEDLKKRNEEEKRKNEELNSNLERLTNTTRELERKVEEMLKEAEDKQNLSFSSLDILSFNRWAVDARHVTQNGNELKNTSGCHAPFDIGPELGKVFLSILSLSTLSLPLSSSHLSTQNIYQMYLSSLSLSLIPSSLPKILPHHKPQFKRFLLLFSLLFSFLFSLSYSFFNRIRCC